MWVLLILDKVQHETFVPELFHEIQSREHFMKHGIISWNTLTLVYIFHCVYFSSIKNCVYREQVSCKSKKNKKDQHVSEWNHDWKAGATKVQYIFRTSVN